MTTSASTIPMPRLTPSAVECYGVTSATGATESRSTGDVMRKEAISLLRKIEGRSGRAKLTPEYWTPEQDLADIESWCREALSFSGVFDSYAGHAEDCSFRFRETCTCTKEIDR